MTRPQNRSKQAAPGGSDLYSGFHYSISFPPDQEITRKPGRGRSWQKRQEAPCGEAGSWDTAMFRRCPVMYGFERTSLCVRAALTTASQLPQCHTQVSSISIYHRDLGTSKSDEARLPARSGTWMPDPDKHQTQPPFPSSGRGRRSIEVQGDKG